MKKSHGFRKLFFIIVLIVSLGGFSLAYVALKRKCNDLKKQIIEVSDELRNQDNRALNLYAIHQQLTSEERILSIAENELAMVVADPPILVLEIEQEKINNLQSLLSDLNE